MMSWGESVVRHTAYIARINRSVWHTHAITVVYYEVTLLQGHSILRGFSLFDLRVH